MEGRCMSETKDRIGRPRARRRKVRPVIEKVIVGIDLQDGFIDDCVEVYMGKNKLLEQDHVTTHLMLGKAASFELPLPRGPVSLTVTVPTQELSAIVDLEAQENTYVGLFVEEGQLKHQVSSVRYGYA
jgi:hypothetical protein